MHVYNKINIDNILINTRTVAIFRALPTCVAQKSCVDCAHTRQNSTFLCSWCESAGHCSDGADRLRQAWNDNICHAANTTTCDNEGHTEWRHSTDDGDGAADALDATTSTVVSAVVSSILAVVLLGLLVGFLYLYGRYNESTAVGRYLKRLQHSYHEFGVAAKNTSLELGRKRAELKAKAAKPAANEFVNPHPMSTNNNVITAAM